MRVRVGTSGYAFDDWTGELRSGDFAQGELFAPIVAERPTFPFYARGVRDKLKAYAETFDTVEINSTYYRTPEAESTASWVRRTPEGFAFWVKVPGDTTHRRDRAAAAPFLAAMAPLSDSGRLAGFLAQFPQSFRRGPATIRYLEQVAEDFPRDPIAVEFRHRSWDHADTYAQLADLGLQLVAVDEPRLRDLFPSKPVAIAEKTLRLAEGRGPPAAYIRLHSRNAENWYAGEALRYDYLYSDEEIAEWLPWIAELDRLVTPQAETYVFFNNCKRGQAAENARRLKQILERPGAPGGG